MATPVMSRGVRSLPRCCLHNRSFDFCCDNHLVSGSYSNLFTSFLAQACTHTPTAPTTVLNKYVCTVAKTRRNEEPLLRAKRNTIYDRHY